MESTGRRVGSPIGARMIVNDREVDYFCGTSYYTLHSHPRVIQAARDAVAAYGLGAATTDLAVPPVEEVKELAKLFFDAETATYVISGYLGAMVLAQALSHDHDLVFVDERSHYSVFDGVTGCGKKVIRFHHLDAADLRQKLKAFTGPGQVPLVMTDGVFPVTGSIAPLPSYAEVLSGYSSALLCTDDSHAVGVIGARGRGTFEYHGMSGGCYHSVGTLSKACGGIGGIIPGDRSLADRIAEHVRVPIGASPPSVPAAAAAAMGLRLLMEQPEMRERLWRNARSVRRGFRELGFNVPDSPIPIVNVKGDAATNLKRVEEKLSRNDIVVLHVPPHGYSDAPDIESLRIAVFSTHTDAQIARLLDAVRGAV